VKTTRRLLHFLFFVLAGVAGVWALTFLSDLSWAAKNYGEHHEATTPFCWFIALILLSLGLALSGARATGPLSFGEILAPLAALAAPALLAAGAAVVFANEIFFSLNDPKGFPVHPTEQVVFPAAGWHGMTSHLLAALLMFLVFGGLWWTMRRGKSRA
jgi:cytochrome c oxidase assembly factor CtaG